MKSSVKKVYFTLLFMALTAYNSFATNVVDSDLSNSAGSNVGKDNVSMYVFIVLMLILAATAPYYERKRSRTSSK